ncbi:hypothetical protein [Nafulsella turpanensis]|uniref:hypothetical protein n=1 Tax=Nafulsella turpanensis TaxID=1265690 RepID=UPI0003493255|nr:hypothetical protein [Nafulsella turpanensis]
MEKRVIESYDIANSNETLHLAQDLAKFIKENRLFHNIQGKAYVNVEGWQYAGARLGILPIIEKLDRIDSGDGEYKYQAEVKLLNLRNQQVIGSGFAICSNKEFGKKSYQEFAIASMAQTRAIGKAYRNILAWIIRAAGYEPTPAEEMDYMIKDDGAEPAVKNPKAAEAPKKSKPAAEKKEETPKEPAASEAAEVQGEPASVKQKTELLMLLNNKAITNEEKNKMLENINSLDSERIEKAILKIRKVINERKERKQEAA